MKAEKDRDVYEQELAKLDYVYPSSIAMKMTSGIVEGLDAFDIDYSNPRYQNDRRPLSAFVDMFGPQESGRPCKKCKRSCQGHYGVINFPVDTTDEFGQRIMIYHYQFIGTVINIFKVYCSTCSELTLDRKEKNTREFVAKLLELPREKRLKKLVNFANPSSSSFTKCNCTHENETGDNLACATQNKRSRGVKNSVALETKPSYRSTASSRDTTTGTSTKATKTFCKARDDYNALMLMSEETAEILGITREDIEGMFIDRMLVLPTVFRPRTGNNRENKFTSSISKVIRACFDFTNGKKGLAETMSRLQDNFKEYSEAWIKAIKGKKGLYMGSVLGKLGGTSARGVAVPDSTVRHGQVSVSDYYARTALCLEVHITAENLGACQALMNNRRVYQVMKARGPTAGVRTQVKTDNFADKSTHYLEVGDVIWRYAQTGDFVVVARQPIQNMQNIVGMELVARPPRKGKNDEEDYAIGVPTTICPGFGLDFDGDTIMIFVAQTPEAQEDIRRKMLLTRNVRSAQRAEPIHGLVHHDILASSLITLPNVKVDRDMWYRLTDHLDYDVRNQAMERIAAAGVEVYSARGLLSTAFPPDFHYNYNDKVVIENGVYMNGFMTSSVISNKSGGIVDKMSIFYSGCGKASCTCEGGLCGDEGYRVTENFIENMSRILSGFLDAFGFTIGYKDTVFEGIEDEVSKAYYRVFDEILNLKPPSSYFEGVKYDKDIKGIVNSTRSLASERGMTSWTMPEVPEEEVLGYDDDEDVGNKIVFMSKTVSGVKGDANTLSGIAVMLGQQELLGKILCKVLTGGSRMLVTTRPGSLDPSGQGFIRNSYVRGLAPNEVFYGSHSGMEGTASTQTITPTVGSQQKDTDKLTENTISYKGGILFNNDTVVNFAAGGDGLSASEVLTVQGTQQSLDVDTILYLINNQ